MILSRAEAISLEIEISVARTHVVGHIAPCSPPLVSIEFAIAKPTIAVFGITTPLRFRNMVVKMYHNSLLLALCSNCVKYLRDFSMENLTSSRSMHTPLIW